MEMIPIILSLAALFFSLHSMLWNKKSFKINHEQAKLSGNLAVLSEIKLKLSDIPKAFRFHGITPEDMLSHDIEPEELAYLAANFIAGQIFYERIPDDYDKPFPEDNYRSTLCNSESVQKAWPLLKKLIDNTPYREKLELTIKRHQ